mmetsp:Transcript_43783/g.81732  ORF Transcript_43783/g.81732 Transcript_43783/m.81732 type:complete len:140 (+) Transcript_43783:195-614(+)
MCKDAAISAYIGIQEGSSCNGAHWAGYTLPASVMEWWLGCQAGTVPGLGDGNECWLRRHKCCRHSGSRRTIHKDRLLTLWREQTLPSQATVHGEGPMAQGAEAGSQAMQVDAQISRFGATTTTTAMAAAVFMATATYKA